MCRSFQDQNILCNNYTTENSSVAQENFGGFTKKMTNKELVNQISGLNSTSTLKNWIQLIREISGKEFKKIKIPISRNPRTHQLSYTVAYDFTDETLDNFKS